MRVSDWICRQIEHTLTEEEANAPWCGRHPSKFKCGICNKRFRTGDVVLSLYTNSTEDADISGNPIVCAKHGGVKECKDQLKQLAGQAVNLPDFIRRRHGMGGQ